MGLNHKIAEVIEANSTGFIAQCYVLNNAPSLGTMVLTKSDNSGEIMGVVYSIETHGMEPGRRVVIRGEKAKNEEEIYRTNPQLEKLLATDFRVLIVGYQLNGKIYHYLPPRPPVIHSFVYSCNKEKVIEFTKTLNFLNLIVEAKLIVSNDEVIAACLRYCSRLYDKPQEFILKAGKELMWILGGDVKRLNSILMRLDIGK